MYDSKIETLQNIGITFLVVAGLLGFFQLTSSCLQKQNDNAAKFMTECIKHGPPLECKVAARESIGAM